MNVTQLKVIDEHLFPSSMCPEYIETNEYKLAAVMHISTGLKVMAILKAPLRKKDLDMQFLEKE